MEYKTAWGKIWDSAAWGDKLLRRQREQGVSRQRMRRQTHTLRERFTVYGEIFRKIFALKIFEPKITANPIPAHLRPWIPSNKKLLALTDIRRMLERTEYIAELRAVCTDSQWLHLCGQYHLDAIK